MDTYNAGKLNNINLNFHLSNNKGFVPLFTLVYLQFPDGAKLEEPKFITPENLSDASIPQTVDFDHKEGALHFQTYLSYKTLETLLGKEEVEKRIKDLVFNYTVDGGTEVTKSYANYDSDPVFIETEKLVLFGKTINIL